jgi:hypothetical protein
MKIPRLVAMIVLLTLGSCSKTEIQYTGNLTIIVTTGTTYGTPTGGTIPIDQVTVGLFDPSILVQRIFAASYALDAKTFNNAKVQFDNINPGNYVVAVIGSTGSYKIAQVKIGQTTTLDLFKR